MNRRTMHAMLAMTLLLFGISAVRAMPAAGGGGSFSIPWHTIDSGGGTSSGGQFELSGTIAQPDATETAATGSNLELAGGFWAAGGGAACDGDANGDGSVGVEDLVEVILAWGTNTPSADFNNDGVVNVEDLVTVVVNWGLCS
ncbi:MAG: hypothetical protein ACYTGR_15920 [Planctomycetota bacterium]